MRYAFIDGNTKIINQLVKDGWEVVNTFPNPHPQPYFFALMLLNHGWEDRYDVENVEDWAYRGAELRQWKPEHPTRDRDTAV